MFTIDQFPKKTSAHDGNRLYADSLDVQLPPYRAAQNYEPRSQKPIVPGSGTLVVSAATADAVALQRYRAVLRQRTPASNGCAGIQRDAGERKYISLEGRWLCQESRSCPPAKNMFGSVIGLPVRLFDKN